MNLSVWPAGWLVGWLAQTPVGSNCFVMKKKANAHGDAEMASHIRTSSPAGRLQFMDFIDQHSTYNNENDKNVSKETDGVEASLSLAFYRTVNGLRLFHPNRCNSELTMPANYVNVETYSRRTTDGRKSFQTFKYLLPAAVDSCTYHCALYHSHINFPYFRCSFTANALH